MKYEKLFWVILFFITLVFQQAQINVKALPAINLSESKAMSLPQTRTITMYELDEDFNTPILEKPCFQYDKNYGCAEATSGGYPFNSPTIQVNVERDYLLDVLAREMDVSTNPATPESLKAQALAVRSYADFRTRLFGPMDNSVNFQIFIPYAFEFYTGGTSYLNDEADPCNEDYVNLVDDPNPNSLNATQQLICDAVTSTHGYYLSQDGFAIDAQFSSDSIFRTATCINDDGRTQCHPYLIRVEDPISAQGLSNSTCNAIDNGSSSIDDPATDWDDHDKVWGMSQKGAIRWSLGNHCAAGGDASTKWSVAWDGDNGYKQILAHYYTGIDILNGNGSPVAPNDRWNLLKYNDPVANGAAYDIYIELQNTSVADWQSDDIKIGYQWTQLHDPANPSGWIDIPQFLPLPLTAKGGALGGDLHIPTPSYSGNLTLHLDLRHANDEESWFSNGANGGWSDATIDINGVTGPTATGTPTVTLTATPMAGGTSTTSTSSGLPMFVCRTLHSGGDVSCVTDGNTITYTFNIHHVSDGIVYNGEYVGSQSPPIQPNTQIYVDYSLTITQYDADRLDIPFDRFYNFIIPDLVRSGDVETQYLYAVNFRDPGYFKTQTFQDNFQATSPSAGFIRFHYAVNSEWGQDTELTGHVTLSGSPIVIGTPTPCTPLCPRDECALAAAKQAATSKVASLSDSISLAVQKYDRLSDQAALLYRLRDEVLSTTEEGQRYIDLYYAHSAEIASIMINNPEIDDQGLDVIDALTPNLQTLLDGQGNTSTITAAQVQQAQAFLDALLPYASPELQQTIAEERIRQPLEQFSGVTMDQAWVYINDDQIVTATPSPTDTATSTPTDTQTLTPTATPTPTSTLPSTPTVTLTNTLAGTATRTPTVTRTPTKTAAASKTFTPTRTPSLTPTATSVGSVFVDGFESGSLSAWGYTTTDGGDLSVSTQAAAIGNYGMQAVINDTHDLVVYDYNPDNEKHYSARFYFNPNSVQITGDGSYYLMAISSDTAGWAACLSFQQQGAYYSLSLCGHDDANTWLDTDEVLISNQWQSIELEWQASSTAGANDGFIKLYIGDELAASITDLDNDTHAITHISLGAQSIDGGSGALYFDGFSSSTGTHIGLDPNGPAVPGLLTRPDELFADDFEGGELSAWSADLSTVDGGDLSVNASAAYQSDYGLQTLIDDTNSLKALDLSPADETQYHARFYFNPNSLTMGNNTAHYILEGYDTDWETTIFQIELLYENGSYKLRPRVKNDTYNFTNGTKQTISNAWHVLEMEWKKSTTAGAGDGSLSFWLDDSLVQTISNVDIDSFSLDQVKLGAVSGIDAATSGSMFFDNFVSKRYSYIGPFAP